MCSTVQRSVCWQRDDIPRRRAISGRWIVLLHLTVACSESQLAPTPPSSATSVASYEGLEFFTAFDADVCRGTLNRAERHAAELASLLDARVPEGQVYLYEDVELVTDACVSKSPVYGCSFGNEIYTTPRALLHELVHLFLATRSDGHAVPAIEEGLAYALQGTRAARPSTLADIDALFEAGTSEDVPPEAARHFFAWAIDSFGIEVLLQAHRGSPEGTNASDALRDLVATLGFPDSAELQQAYEQTSAFEYPSLPDTVATISAAELAAGTVLSTGCDGSYAEGPTDGTISNRFRMEVLEPGEYEVSYAPLPIELFQPWLVRPEPLVEEQPIEELRTVCLASLPSRHFLFPVEGVYEVFFEHSNEDVLDLTLRTVALGSDTCTPS